LLRRAYSTVEKACFCSVAPVVDCIQGLRIARARRLIASFCALTTPNTQHAHNLLSSKGYYCTTGLLEQTVRQHFHEWRSHGRSPLARVGGQTIFQKLTRGLCEHHGLCLSQNLMGWTNHRWQSIDQRDKGEMIHGRRWSVHPIRF